MVKPLKINFSNGLSAALIQADASTALSFILHQFALEGQHPVMVLIGGASKLSDTDFKRLQRLFVEVLAPLAQKWQAVVIDGGTDAGVMRLMGQARAATGADFPLIGILPIELAILPDQPIASPNASPLEPHHSHFILVPGSQWGDESTWIASVASALSTARSVTILVNGGEVTWKDASQSVKADRSLIVVAGTGRTADIIAAALYGDFKDARAEALVSSGLVRAIALDDVANTLATTLEDIFGAKS